MNPTPAQIKETRLLAGLHQHQAAALLDSSARQWRKWETGRVAMSEALWVLFILKARKPELYQEVFRP